MQNNVLEYLESTVVRLPDKAAYCNERDSLTFSQVYRYSRAIGTVLFHDGIYRQPVVVFMKKHPNAVAAFYGCVYGGNYYVPLDEEMPLFRIELILNMLKPKGIICDASTAMQMDKFPDVKAHIYLFEEMIESEIDEAALSQVRNNHIDTDPLYVVFTSGSTGVPKGVVACHRSVIDYIEALSATLSFSEETVFGNQSPFYFDACLKELYPTMKFGATTYIVPKSLFMFPVKLVEFLNEHRINTVCWVVSALTMISSFGTFDTVVPKYLRTVAFGSEVFPIKQFNIWRAALPDAKFTNLYGPTEATGMSCYYHVNRNFEETDVLPIGKPFKNTEILLLNEENRRAAPGESGEICIRGTALTMGYYKQFEKTGEVFVQNPLNDCYPELIYRTGDIGCYNAFGELVFVSRKDNQIKHMGHRIELGEIEINASMFAGVRTSCAVYDKLHSKIVLYYVGDVDKASLTGYLRGRLPRYMLPNRIEQLEIMPLTPNGKIDRRLLKEVAEQKD